MYKMIIAEDEHNIRNAIVRFVNWQEIGFSIAGVFSTGEEALQFACENSIDAVLTDVRMATLDGLELIEKLCAMNPEIKFVILSGYDDFNYAQKAIRSGVFDYILKPVSFRQLSETFARLKELMDRERENNETLNHALSMLREQFFNNLVKGSFPDDEEILKRSDELGLDLKRNKYWLARIEGDFYYDDTIAAAERSGLKDSVRNILENLLGKYSAGFVFNNDVSELSILINGLNNGEQVIELLEEMKNSVFDKLKQTITVSLSAPFLSLAECHDAYEEAGKGIECRRSNKTERKIIEKVKEYIKEHYNEDISLEALSKDIYMNSSYFSRLFKAETGENFTEYLTRVRINNAMRMLRETNMKIYEVSQLVGYSNYRHFAEVFKKMVGCNAAEYREKA